MKFFWKIFFSTMFISVICVTLSGYQIIRSNFQSQQESEVSIVQNYGEIVYWSLYNEFENVDFDLFLASKEDDRAVQEAVSQIVRYLSINQMNQKIAFSVVDRDQTELFSSLDSELDKSMISSIGNNDMGWTVQKKNGEFYVQALRPIVLLERTFYIETVRNVTHLYDSQREQYKNLIEMTFGMMLLAGIFTFLVSKLLLRRIVALTEITKIISNGDLRKRTISKGVDEIALLSQNFNNMADRLEEKICELKDEAERKEMFVGAFSHELKTPLTSIIGYSDLLRQKEMNAEQRQICAEYIFAEGKRLETLSMRLLELIVLKKRSIEPKLVSIRNALEEVKTVVTPKLIDSQIELIYDVEEAMVRMEAELMKTVFINVIDNARNAIEVCGKITVSGRKKEKGYVIEIQDNGKGMESAELEKITNAFYMVDQSRSRKHGGVGLGLAICSEILELHGFEIQFKSTVNVGTSVIITMKEVPHEAN